MMIALKAFLGLCRSEASLFKRSMLGFGCLPFGVTLTSHFKRTNHATVWEGTFSSSSKRRRNDPIWTRTPTRTFVKGSKLTFLNLLGWNLDSRIQFFQTKATKIKRGKHSRGVSSNCVQSDSVLQLAGKLGLRGSPYGFAPDRPNLFRRVRTPVSSKPFVPAQIAFVACACS